MKIPSYLNADYEICNFKPNTCGDVDVGFWVGELNH